MEKIRKFLTAFLIIIAIIGIADEGLFQFWKRSNSGLTFTNGTNFVAFLESDVNPSKMRQGQIITFKLATEANKAGSDKLPELPNGTHFIAKVQSIINDNGRKTAWFEFIFIQTPDGEKHSLSAFLVASDSPSESSGIILRDEGWASIGIATAFMVGSLPAIPIGAVAGYSLSRSSSRHIESPKSFFTSEIKQGFLVGIQLNRDHHLPYRRNHKDFLTKIY